MNILDLSEHNVLSEEQDAYDYRITIRFISSLSPCPDCGNDNLHLFGTRCQMFMGWPRQGKRVGIWVQRQRYRCKTCGRTFLEYLPDMDEKRRATRGLVRYIEQESLKRTFSSISDEVGLSEKTIRNIFHAHIRRLDEETRPETPEWLGIDEFRFTKWQFWTIITDLKRRKIVDMLPDREKMTVVRYLSALPNREKVLVVCMDMNWSGFREAVEEALPDARIVVDRFHFVRMVNEVLEAALRDIQGRLPPKRRQVLTGVKPLLLKRKQRLSKGERLILEECFELIPLLGQAYELKEGFCDLYASKDRAQALGECTRLQSQIPAELKAAFEPLLKAVRSWDDEILAYFDEHVTNAYSESLNNLIRFVNYAGRGYSFEVIRAKMLYQVGRHEPRKPSYRRKWLSSETVAGE